MKSNKTSLHVLSLLYFPATILVSHPLMKKSGEHKISVDRNVCVGEGGKSLQKQSSFFLVVYIYDDDVSKLLVHHMCSLTTPQPLSINLQCSKIFPRKVFVPLPVFPTGNADSRSAAVILNESKRKTMLLI